MTNWLKKKQTDDDAKPANMSEKAGDAKKAKEQKRVVQKRINAGLNVRISSLGDACVYQFETINISTSGLLLRCSDPERYPFLSRLTLVDAVLQLPQEGGREASAIKFIGKVMRAPEEEQQAKGDGYGIKFVQMSWDETRLLEDYITKFGTMVKEEKTSFLESA